MTTVLIELKSFGFKHFSFNHPEFTTNIYSLTQRYTCFMVHQPYTCINLHSNWSMVKIHPFPLIWLKGLWLGLWMACRVSLTVNPLSWHRWDQLEGIWHDRAAHPHCHVKLALSQERASSQGHTVHLQTCSSKEEPLLKELGAPCFVFSANSLWKEPFWSLLLRPYTFKTAWRAVIFNQIL